MSKNNLSMNSIQSIVQLIGIFLLATFLVVSLVAVLVLATDFVLLIFLAILFGVFLTKTSKLLGNYVPIGYGWNLAIVTTLILTAFFGGLGLFGIKIENRLDAMSKNLDESGEKIEQWIGEHPIAQSIFKKIPFASDLLDPEKIFDQKNPQSSNSRVSENPARPESVPQNDFDLEDQKSSAPGSDSDQSTTNSEDSAAPIPSRVIQKTAGRVFAVFQRMLSTSLGLVANLGLIFFIGAFLAVDPPLYRDGFAKLFPTDNRQRVTEVLDQMGNAMFAWLNGRFLSMLITGAGTAIALLLLGVPMPITIGVLTGLLTFIPNIGGIIALLVASTMALTQGPATLAWVVIIYSGLQLVESNIITPLVQQHQTSIPPALLIGFQVILGAMTGFLGLLVATPFLAAMLVLVREFWIKDILGDSSVETSANT